jgi:ABC-2 type transport system permease protein
LRRDRERTGVLNVYRAFVGLLLNEVRTLLRARISLFWTFAFPLVFLAMMLMSYGNQGSLGAASIEIVDRDHSARSAEYVAAVRSAFTSGDPIVGRLSFPEPNSPPARGAVRVTIPAGFAEALSRQQPMGIEVAYDFASGFSTQVASKIFKPLTIRFNAQLARAPMLVAVDVRNLGSRIPIPFTLYMLTGVMVMSMMTAGMNSTCNAIAEMRQRNTFKFMAMLPMRPWTYLAAVLTARLIMVFLSAHVLLLVAAYGFGLAIPPLFDRFGDVALVLIAGGTMLIAAGLAVSARIQRVATAGMVTNFIYLSMVFVADLTMPLSSYSEHTRAWLALLPVSQFVVALRATLIDGVSVSQLGQPFLIMGACTVGFLLITRLLFFWHKT